MSTLIHMTPQACNVQRPCTDPDYRYITLYSNPQTLEIGPGQEALINLCLTFKLSPYHFGIIKPLHDLPLGLYFQDTLVASNHYTTLQLINYSTEPLVIKPYTPIGRFNLVR